jgi:hypothetical protein
MLLVAAGTMQGLLVCELLLRRILFLCLPSRRLALQRYADNAALSSFAALLLQTATVPLQAFASVLATLGRFWALAVFGCICFAALLTLSSSSVHAYTVIARMYNIGVSPFVTAGQWLFVILDFVFRAVTPLWNGLVFFGAQILRNIVLPYSFHNIETLPEMLQGLTLMLVSLGSSVGTWLQNIMECGVMHETAVRVCGESVSGGKQDCSAAFTPLYTECFAAPNHLTIDLLTPGLFARQAVLALRRVFASHCGVAALVLNFLLFPLAELHLYAALHAVAIKERETAAAPFKALADELDLFLGRHFSKFLAAALEMSYMCGFVVFVIRRHRLQEKEGSFKETPIPVILPIGAFTWAVRPLITC